MESRRFEHTLMGTALAVATVGGIALAANHITPEQAPPTRHYDVVPGADRLPQVPENPRADPSAYTYINVKEIARNIDPLDYKYLTNSAPEGEPADKVKLLPVGTSAPVIDFLIGSDGKLHYKDYGVAGTETPVLLDVVSAASPLLEPALRDGQVSQIHIRAFQPNQFPDTPELEPRTEFLEVAHDYNDNGRPAIYVYLSAEDKLPTETASTVLTHEASHRLTGQDPSMTLTPEKSKAYTEACKIMQKSALEYISQDSSTLIQSLGQLEALAPREYAPALQEVAESIKNATYGEAAQLKLDAGEVPSCFLMTPWQAIVASVKSKNINGGDMAKLLEAPHVENIVSEITEDWHDAVKESDIYRTLSESTYLDPIHKADNEKWGHSYEDKPELEATSANLLLTASMDEFCQHVNDLKPELREATLDVMEQVILTLRQQHPNDPEFLKLAEQRYREFRTRVHS
jgi:hypothetical protein